MESKVKLVPEAIQTSQDQSLGINQNITSAETNTQDNEIFFDNSQIIKG